jgi:D-alanyl-D-alanine carboxypeptidase
MNTNFILKLAMTTAVVAIPSIGCTSIGISSTMKVSSEASSKKAHAWAMKAEKAKADGKLDKAMGYSELAVEADMQNLEYRAQLAQIYMSQGRFQSAERTWMDVMDLGQVDPRSVISLSLTRIAQGKVESAMALVEANRSIIPASDYALTLALAGDSSRAVEILTDAIRNDNATARTRQNLALAYALEGRWPEARVMAQQDMPQSRVNERIAEWAQYARPGAYQMRVAGLLKVTPREDSGQPIRLALSSVQNGLAQAPANTIMAQTDADSYSSELAAVGPAPESESSGFAASAAAVAPAAMMAVPAMAPAPDPVVSAPVMAQSNAQGAKSLGFLPNGVEMVSIPVLASYDVKEVPLIKAAKGPAKQAMTGNKPVKLALADVAPKTSKAANVSGTHACNWAHIIRRLVQKLLGIN